jgi:hypothetical protein
VVPRFAGPGQGGRVRGQADGSFAGVVDTGWRCGLHQHRDRAPGTDQKNQAPGSNSRKFLQKISLTAHDRATGYSGFLYVERPNSAIDNGDALIFSGQIEIRPSAATGYPAISRVD